VRVSGLAHDGGLFAESFLAVDLGREQSGESVARLSADGSDTTSEEKGGPLVSIGFLGPVILYSMTP